MPSLPSSPAKSAVSPAKSKGATKSKGPTKSKKEEEKEEEKAEEVASPEKSEEGEAEEDPDDKEEEEEEEEEEKEEVKIKLYKSTRLKGYITLVLSSAINFHSALFSDDPALQNAIPASLEQKRYAMAVACTSMTLAGIIAILHFDQFTPLQKYWIKAFQPKSFLELGLILILVIWWVVATWIQTSVRGICGDGKGQYNLYFSTWACCYISIWTLERWWVAYGFSSFQSFVSSWPNRGPGWLAIFFLSVCTLLAYLDLFLNWEEAIENPILQEQFGKIGQGQWEFLLFIASFTIPCGLTFVVIEIFRETDQQTDWEKISEGFVLFILVMSWIPSVIIATTPGGIAFLVGNSYFFTWGLTIFVMETSVWWVHDKRSAMQKSLQEQEEEYRRIQKQVLAKGREQAAAAEVVGQDDKEVKLPSQIETTTSPRSDDLSAYSPEYIAEA